jgi:hypothetical protein
VSKIHKLTTVSRLDVALNGTPPFPFYWPVWVVALIQSSLISFVAFVGNPKPIFYMVEIPVFLAGVVGEFIAVRYSRRRMDVARGLLREHLRHTVEAMDQ